MVVLLPCRRIFKTSSKKNPTNLGFVASVQYHEGSTSLSCEMHKDAWVGCINLNEDLVKLLKCHSNDHTLHRVP